MSRVLWLNMYSIKAEMVETHCTQIWHQQDHREGNVLVVLTNSYWSNQQGKYYTKPIDLQPLAVIRHSRLPWYEWWPVTEHFINHSQTTQQTFLPIGESDGMWTGSPVHYWHTPWYSPLPLLIIEFMWEWNLRLKWHPQLPPGPKHDK
jgi:hypothetical protein